MDEESLSTTRLTLEPGEPAAGPWRLVPIEEVVDRLQQEAGVPLTGPRIVAIDGRGGAGKSTLVEQLRELVPASAVVHTDDVAWHHAFFDWAELLAGGVLEPLRRGEAVDFRPPAWEQRGRLGSIQVPAGLETVWIEGTGVVREDLAHLIDASVWVQVDLEEAASRLAARDGQAPEQVQLVADWALEENPFMIREQPWANATLVVAGSPVGLTATATQVAVAPPAT